MTFHACVTRSAEPSMRRCRAPARVAAMTVRHDTGPLRPLNLPARLPCPCDGHCPRCTPAIQPKLTIGPLDEHLVHRCTRSGVASIDGTPLPVSHAGDATEREAQYVAGQIRRMTFPSGPTGMTPTGLQPRRLGVAPVRSAAVGPVNLSSAGIQAIRHPPGVQPLPAPVRAFLQPRFGADFGSVHVHTGPQAASLNAHLRARAFTCGRDIWLGAGESPTNLTLMAHEFTHVLQQCAPTGTFAIQREVAPAPPQCDQVHMDAVNAALGTARTWRSRVLAWFETRLNNLRRRTPPVAGAYGQVGASVVRDLARLEHDFRISDLIRDRGSVFPRSESDPIRARDIRNFSEASSEIRRRFRDVNLDGLTFQCQLATPPQLRGGRMHPIPGESLPGSGEVTIFTQVFDAQVPDTPAAIVLHETFHATFSDFDHDTYCSETGYPGDRLLTNADSYASFASIVVTGHDYRVIGVPATRIVVPVPAPGGP